MTRMAYSVVTRPLCVPINLCARVVPVRPNVRKHLRNVCVQAKDDEQSKPSSSGSTEVSQWEGIVGNVGSWIAYGVILFYIFAVSPNQTPSRDFIYVKELVNYADGGGYDINAVLYSLFNLMGVYPGLYACLLIPAARSTNKVPVWPFVSASFFLGMLALFPYLCLWQPDSEKTAPPTSDDMKEGAGRYGFQASESAWLPGALMLAGGWLLANALTAGIPAWNAFFKLFDESRFVHVTSLDFFGLTLLMPYIMWWDADKRDWAQRNWGVPVLSLLPIVGPAAYLMLRPKAKRVE